MKKVLPKSPLAAAGVGLLVGAGIAGFKTWSLVKNGEMEPKEAVTQVIRQGLVFGGVAAVTTLAGGGGGGGVGLAAMSMAGLGGGRGGGGGGGMLGMLLGTSGGRAGGGRGGAGAGRGGAGNRGGTGGNALDALSEVVVSMFEGTSEEEGQDGAGGEAVHNAVAGPSLVQADPEEDEQQATPKKPSARKAKKA